jgi:hypothetical protein
MKLRGWPPPAACRATCLTRGRHDAPPSSASQSVGTGRALPGSSTPGPRPPPLLPPFGAAAPPPPDCRSLQRAPGWAAVPMDTARSTPNEDREMGSRTWARSTGKDRRVAARTRGRGRAGGVAPTGKAGRRRTKAPAAWPRSSTGCPLLALGPCSHHAPGRRHRPSPAVRRGGPASSSIATW